MTGGRARAVQEIFVLSSFYVRFLYIKRGQKVYKVNVVMLSSSFIFCHPPHLCLSSKVSSPSKMLKRPLLLREVMPLLKAEILSGTIVIEMVGEIKQLEILLP